MTMKCLHNLLDNKGVTSKKLKVAGVYYELIQHWEVLSIRFKKCSEPKIKLNWNEIFKRKVLGNELLPTPPCFCQFHFQIFISTAFRNGVSNQLLWGFTEPRIYWVQPYTWLEDPTTARISPPLLKADWYLYEAYHRSVWANARNILNIW